MAQGVTKQRFGRIAVTDKLNELIEQVNPIIEMEGKGGVVITKSEGRWMLTFRLGDAGFDTVTEQRCVNGSLVERTYLIQSTP